ncbi:rCG22529 [Rattus norvegicus]|uniref:RCG22529 n=1 Tax=Rattus norvegicus TaxID=10116 RepID=A6INF7_RAT|nr:rCG22529 [Rattus norvegicus]
MCAKAEPHHNWKEGFLFLFLFLFFVNNKSRGSQCNQIPCNKMLVSLFLVNVLSFGGSCRKVTWESLHSTEVLLVHFW